MLRASSGTILIPADRISPNPWNPQVQTDDEFNMLVKSIEETGGLIEPILVRPKDGGFRWKDVVTGEEGGQPVARYQGKATFEIIHGEHRFKAAVHLGQSEIPAMVIEGVDDDLARFLTVRLNTLHGTLDPQRLLSIPCR